MVYASLGGMDLKMIHLFNSFDLCMFYFYFSFSFFFYE